ncbi:MAG: acetylglutamate kinase [Planctomycetota bacterium]
MDNIEILKQALPYIRRYRNKTFVVKVGGELVADEAVLDSLAADVSLLYQFGIRVVIIHGGGPQLSQLSEKLGIESEKINGRRITDDSTLELAKMVFAGGISTDILSGLRSHGTPGVGLSGVDGDLVVAKRRPPKRIVDKQTGEERDVDFQNVGDIETVDPQVLRVLLENRFVPVVASRGADLQGNVLNINAHPIAAEIAATLPAEKFFVLTNVSGVLRDIEDPSSRVSYLTVSGVEQMIDSKVIVGGMVPKLTAALGAVRSGVSRAHIINGLQPNSLLYEVFTVSGHGTMILGEEEEAAYLAEQVDA